MTNEIGTQKPQPSWPIAAALGISGFLFFLYIYTLVAPIIRNPNIIAPYSTRQAGRSRRKSKSSWLSRWLLGTRAPRDLQQITPSHSRSSRRTANHDQSPPPSSTSHNHYTHAYFPSSPSSAKFSLHPATPSRPSFRNTSNPSYTPLHPAISPSFSTTPTGVRVSRLDYDSPSHNPQVRVAQHTLSPPPPAYVSSPNTPSPDYAPVFVNQGHGYATPPMSPAHSTRAPSAEGAASTWSYYSPSALASPSASSLHRAISRSSSSHSISNGLPPPSPSYDATTGSPGSLTVPPFNRGPVGRSISGSSTGSASSASMYSASSAHHQAPSSQGHASPPSRHGHMDAAQVPPRKDEHAQKSPPRVLTKRRADKGKDSNTLDYFPLPPPLTVRTTNTGPYTPKITTSASVNAIGSQTTQYWPPSSSQLPTPPVSAASSTSSHPYHRPGPMPASPSFVPSNVQAYPPPPSREIRESRSDSAVHTMSSERLARQPILAAHMYPRNEAGAPMIHLKASPTLRGTAGKF